MYTDPCHRDNRHQLPTTGNGKYLVGNEPSKRRKINTRKNHILPGTNHIASQVYGTHVERDPPKPHMSPKIVLASSVMADVYAHSAATSEQTSAPLSMMFSHDGSTDLKSTLLNKTTLTIQFSSCILPARDDIQLVCNTN
jgi:hypothetical protein